MYECRVGVRCRAKIGVNAARSILYLTGNRQLQIPYPFSNCVSACHRSLSFGSASDLIELLDFYDRKWCERNFYL